LDALEFCQACLTGNLDKVNEALEQNATLANSFGEVHPDHRAFMQLENAEAGWSALHLAAHYGQSGIVKLLINSGAKVNAVAQNVIANTPLMAAIAGGHIAIVKLLLEYGADPKLKDAAGHDALQLAEIDGKREILGVLRLVR